MTKSIRLLLVDDHAIVRSGLRMLLDSQPDMTVVAEAERGEQALARLCQQRADVMILDLSMPGIGGLETLRRARLRYQDLQILVLSVHDEVVYQQQAHLIGASGFISKAANPERMLAAVRALAQGKSHWPELPGGEEATGLKAVIDGFNTREFEVFCRLAKGLSVARIAEELCVSYKTVANYGTCVRRKLQVSSTAELANIARALGVLPNHMP
ncbi:MAG: response regulator transcription factor [Methylococcales bacterium]|nr:response regulator transcription factor [Methylococcales bacterium]